MGFFCIFSGGLFGTTDRVIEVSGLHCDAVFDGFFVLRNV